MTKQIIIIGSGPSGIAAATKLLDNGFTNLTILEAENRIGGRVNTIPYGESAIDMGAQWCHGETDNVVYQMAKDKNILEPSEFLSTETAFYQSNGDALPKNISRKLLQTADGIMGKSEAMKAYKGSLGNFFMENYNQQILENELKDVDMSIHRRFTDYYEKSTNSMDCTNSWYENSSISNTEYLPCEGNFTLAWKGKGYKTVLDLLQKKIPENNNSLDIQPYLQLNKEVKKISYGNTDGKSPVRVECADGSVYTGDHVICTVSLGVLKYNHYFLFDPILPQKKIDTIDGLDFGTMNKIYLEWEEPFWSENEKHGIAFLWRPEEIKIIREEGNHWLESFFILSPVDYHPNLLCGWLTGPHARHTEQLSDEEIKSAVTSMLRMFLKHIHIPNPVRVKRSTWFTNPHFRGSYSFYSLKSDGYGAKISTLGEPLNDSDGKPVVQFAGEATSPAHFSTVHGAVETGWREAKRIIDLYS